MPPVISPKDPMDLIDVNVRWAFRAAGVHSALMWSPSSDVAFLPAGLRRRGPA